MTEQMIPARNPVCCGRAVPPAGTDQHAASPNTVETESGFDMEWQFATCLYCAQSISRFRILLSGNWFDQWGNIDESAYRIDNSRRPE